MKDKDTKALEMLMEEVNQKDSRRYSQQATTKIYKGDEEYHIAAEFIFAISRDFDSEIEGYVITDWNVLGTNAPDVKSGMSMKEVEELGYNWDSPFNI